MWENKGRNEWDFCLICFVFILKLHHITILIRNGRDEILHRQRICNFKYSTLHISWFICLNAESMIWKVRLWRVSVRSVKSRKSRGIHLYLKEYKFRVNVVSKSRTQEEGPLRSTGCFGRTVEVKIQGI